MHLMKNRDQDQWRTQTSPGRRAAAPCARPGPPGPARTAAWGRIVAWPCHRSTSLPRGFVGQREQSHPQQIRWTTLVRWGSGGGRDSRPALRSPVPPAPPGHPVGSSVGSSPPSTPLRRLTGLDAAKAEQGFFLLFFGFCLAATATHTHTLLTLAGPIQNARLKTCVATACFSGVRLLLIHRGHAAPPDLARPALARFNWPHAFLFCLAPALRFGVRAGQPWSCFAYCFFLSSSLSLFPVRSLGARCF